jgi:hypothetical protein
MALVCVCEVQTRGMKREKELGAKAGVANGEGRGEAVVKVQSRELLQPRKAE